MDTTFSKLIIHKDFKDSIQEVRNSKIYIGNLGSGKFESENEFDLNFGDYELEGITELKKYDLDGKNGSFVNQRLNNVVAYDESILKFSSLEGEGVLTSHSIVKLDKKDYLASSYIVFHFYTRSEKIAKDNKTIRLSENISDLIKADYSNERNNFLVENVPSNSLLFIDGPLIGKNLNADTVKLNNALLQKNIFPIFVVKNSSSNLITNKVGTLKNNYNSDLHWASIFLGDGQRTNFFLYTDKINKEFSKKFCYIKSFNKSPQRVEIYPKTFELFENDVHELMDLIYYYFIANGNVKNQQIRPIAIAEKFARNTISMFDLNVILKYTGLTPSVNEERFNL